MTLPTSSFEPINAQNLPKLPSKALFWVNVKRFIWVPILNLLGLLLFLPGVILSQGSRQVFRMQQRENYAVDWFNEISYGSGFLWVLLVGVSIMWAAILFNYLNEGKSVTFFHSLPLNRKTLYCNLSLVGLGGLLLPVVLTALCCILLRFMGEIGTLYTTLDVLRWSVFYFAMELVFFSSAVFVGMFTGLPLVQPIFTVILHLLPWALYGMTCTVLCMGIYGFPDYAQTMDWIEYLPSIRMFLGSDMFQGNASLWFYTAGISLATVSFLGAGLWLYGKRPLERTGDIIVFPVMRPIFKYGVTYCASLSGSLLTAGLLNETISWWMLLLWALVGYCGAEMLLQKSVRIFKAWKGLAVYGLVTIVLMGTVYFDLTGYQRRLPIANEVAAVVVNGDAQVYEGIKALEMLPATGQRILPQLVDQMDPRLCFQAPENIEAVLKIHQQLIEQRPKKGTGWRGQQLTYLMKDGSLIRRRYPLNLVAHPQEAKILYESGEYKTYRRNISFAKAEDLIWVRLGSNSRQGAKIDILGQAEMAGFLAALHQDIQDEPFEAMEGQQGSYLRLEYRYKMPELNWEVLRDMAPHVFDEALEKRMLNYGPDHSQDTRGLQGPDKVQYEENYSSLNIPGSYRHTIQWLNAQGYGEKLKPSAKEFSYLRLYQTLNYSGNLRDYDESVRLYEAKQANLEAYSLPTGERKDTDRAQADLTHLDYTEIRDQGLIQKILDEEAYSPYFLPYGEQPGDKMVYRLDFHNEEGNYRFTGYFYDGLPNLLQALWEEQPK